MAITSSGTITMANIVSEFGPAGNLPASISSYYKGGLFVRNTGINSRVPASGTIKFSDFYGAVKYVGSATINVRQETTSQYQNNNDGQVTVTVNGNSPSYTVTWPGPSGQTRTMFAGQSYTVGGYDQTNAPTITITDTAGTRNFGPYTIGYGGSIVMYGPFNF